MEEMKIREYADSRGISYEAVRQLIKRHADKIPGVEKRKDGTTLTSAAIEYLDHVRRTSPVVVVNDKMAQENEKLKAEKENLVMQMALLLEDRVNQIKTIEDKANKVMDLSENAAKTALELIEVNRELSRIKPVMEKLKAENESLEAENRQLKETLSKSDPAAVERLKEDYANLRADRDRLKAECSRLEERLEGQKKSRGLLSRMIRR